MAVEVLSSYRIRARRFALFGLVLLAGCGTSREAEGGGEDVDGVVTQMAAETQPDAESLMFHVQLAGDRIRSAYEFLDATTNIEIYGPESEELVELIHQMRGDAPPRESRGRAGPEGLERP